MKQLQQQAPVTARDYKKAYIKLLTAAATSVKNGVKSVDNYFFDEDGSDADIKPYFYGSLSFSLLVTIFVYAIIY